MKLPDTAISEFQEIYAERFGRKIDREKAEAEGLKLLRLVRLVYPGYTGHMSQSPGERKQP
jgi:hypothetical protein